MINITRKEKTFNRWLVWVEHSPEESAYLEFEGLDEPTDKEVEAKYQQWLAERELNGTTE